MCSLVIDPTQKTKYPPLAEGLYQAVLAEIVDLGEVQGKFDEYPIHKVQFVFQLDALRDDGKRHEVRSFAERFSVQEKANVRTRYLEKIFGKAQFAAMLENAGTAFDIGVAVGQNCMIEVVHDKSGEYANIGSVVGYRGGNPMPISADYVPLQTREGYKPPMNYANAGGIEGAESQQAVAPPGAPMPPTNRPQASPTTAPDLLTDAQQNAIIGYGRRVFGAEAGAELVKMIGKPIHQLSAQDASAVIDRLRAIISGQADMAGGVAMPNAAAQQQAHAAQLAAGYDETVSDPDVFDLPEGSPAAREALAAAHVG